MSFISLTVVSCKDSKKHSNHEAHSEMNHDNSDGHPDGIKKELAVNTNQNESAEATLNDYFALKDALVADDNVKAKALGGTLVASLGNLEKSIYSESEQQELTEMIEDATEHAETYFRK